MDMAVPPCPVRSPPTGGKRKTHSSGGKDTLPPPPLFCFLIGDLSDGDVDGQFLLTVGLKTDNWQTPSLAGEGVACLEITAFSAYVMFLFSPHG